MTRIAPSPMPGLAADRLDRDDRAERAPAQGPGTPFRAALRKADKMARAVDDPPPAQPQVQPQLQAQPGEAGEVGEVGQVGRVGQIGSIGDGVAGSNDGASAAPTVHGARAAGAAANSADRGTAGEDLAGAALAGAGLAGPSAATAQGATAEVSDSPVTVWVAAAVVRAIGSFGGAGAGAKAAQGMTAANAATAARAASAGAARADAAAAPAALAAAGLDAALPALSPLEQAVHDLIGRAIAHDDKDARDPGPDTAAPDASSVSLGILSSAAPAAPAAPGHTPVGAPAHAAPLAQLPEPAANPSHVHLVLEDGPERTVVTVAVRGSEVRVALRTSDDATGDALARNAASLDHAMRARGLSLGELTSERDPQGERPSRDPEPHERRAPHAEPFELEEKP